MADSPGPCAGTIRLLAALSPSGRPFTVRTALEADECRWFEAAVENKLVEFRDCTPGCSRLKQRRASGPDEFVTPAGVLRHLFSSPDAAEPSLNREYVPHIAAFARAILDFGYDRNRASFSLYRRFSKDLLTKRAGTSYETDAEFYDETGAIHLQIEAKAESRQVDHIARQLDRAGDLRELPAGTVKEIEYVLDLAPRHLWLVGPGTVEPAAHIFAVEVDGLTARFTRLDSFPSPPGAEAAQRTQGTEAAEPEDEFTCPQCHSNDIRGVRQPGDERIHLRCEQCGHSWVRLPRPSCPRCGAGDVETGGYTGWAYDDPQEAKDDPMASWDYVERRTFRCRRCRHVWGTAP